jgi:hypothetical protein
MTMPIPFALAVLFVGTIQAPSVNDIAKQLDSTNPTTIAWGAYNAAAYHRDDMIPRLQQLLETPPATDRMEQYAFTDVVLDALIQLKAKIPARMVVPYIEKRPVQAFVLLANATGRHDVLLRLLPRLAGYQWFAAADMLFEDRAPDLIAELIRPLRLRLAIYVVDNEASGGSGSGNAASRGIGDGIGQSPRDYPPHAEYRFESPGVGFVVLAAGPRPVYYSRNVTRTFQYGVSEVSVSGPTDDDRLAYLHAMADPSGAPILRAETVERIRWTSAGALVSRVRDLRAELLQRFRYMVERADQSRSLPASRPIDPPVDVRLEDRRSDRTVPLPKIEQIARADR